MIMFKKDRKEVKVMDENVKCPNCESINFVTDDYEEDFTDDGVVSYYWRCKCNTCHKIFHVTERYIRESTNVMTDKEWEEE